MTDIVYGVNLLPDVMNAIKHSALIVTDSNVKNLYPSLTHNAYVVPAGESSKNKDVLFDVISEMCARNISRGDTVTAIGGGVVGDITGLAAALYMRGIDYINIPTTLLSMVDSGIGGKTAINFGGVKNLVGAFKMPRRTIISYAFLDTLNERERLSGYGEMIKTCLLTCDSFELLYAKYNGIKAFDHTDIYDLIETCIDIKSRVVNADPKETSLRKILNVGHTVGHALESINGDAYSHGEYVLKGMLTECSMCKDIISNEYYNQIIDIFKIFTVMPRTTSKSVCNVALHDKKNNGGQITLMIPTDIGEVTEIAMKPEEFISRYDTALKESKRV